MPAYQFQVPGLGTVTAAADTEACARLQVGETLGIDPDRLSLIAREAGTPVFEGDPSQRDAFGDDECWGDTGYCDCSACDPDLVRLTPGQVAAGAAGAVALGVAILLVLWRR
jgi:hypothetical protein